MTTININEAKTHLSRYTRRVKAGETIILADRNKPFAEIRPLTDASAKKAKRKLGQLAGSVSHMDGFFDADVGIEESFLDAPLTTGPSAPEDTSNRE